MLQVKRIAVDALILAGGKNLRMQGNYKGDLKAGGETFADHLIREMKKISDHIYLSYGAVSHGEKEGCTVIRDIHPGCGPVSGLEAGLTFCCSEYLLAAACDMPFLRAEFYELLLDRGAEEAEKTGLFPDCIVPLLHGRPDVLAAVYSKRMLPVIRRLIGQGIYKPRAAAEQVNTLYVPLDGLLEYAVMLQNINTPEEYSKITERSL